MNQGLAVGQVWRTPNSGCGSGSLSGDRLLAEHSTSRAAFRQRTRKVVSQASTHNGPRLARPKADHQPPVLKGGLHRKKDWRQRCRICSRRRHLTSVTRSPTLAMASPSSWPVWVPSTLSGAAPLTVGVRYLRNCGLAKSEGGYSASVTTCRITWGGSNVRTDCL